MITRALTRISFKGNSALEGSFNGIGDISSSKVSVYFNRTNSPSLIRKRALNGLFRIS